jgi:CheY-like chemotaxis protein
MPHSASRANGRSHTATVLVVEDDRDTRNLEQLALEHCGHRVLTAANGLEALAVLRQHQPAVIVLDLMMPVMDGLTFLDERQRSVDPRSRAVPVICVSAAGPTLTAEAIRRGAIDCIPKPADLDRLCERIEELSSADARLN